MDILTKKGEQTVKDEYIAYQLFQSNYPHYNIVSTPKDKPSDFDGLLIRDKRIVSVIETKCRYDCDLNKFKTDYNSEWLVTFDKILKIKGIADSMRVSVVGFLYLVPSRVLLVKTLIDRGTFLTDMGIRTTKTKRSVNGGKAVRTNAFIDMRFAKELI